MRKIAGIIAASALALGGLALATPAQAEPGVSYGPTFDVFSGARPAPVKGAKGGIYGAFGHCHGMDEDESILTVQVWQKHKGWDHDFITRPGVKIWTYHGTDALDIHRFPVGTWFVDSWLDCANGAGGTSDEVTVGYLKDSQTVSKGEYKRIHKGQTKKRVEKIIGGKLHYNGKERGTRYYDKDSTSWSYPYVAFEFRHGKLVKKYRTFG